MSAPRLFLVPAILIMGMAAGAAQSDDSIRLRGAIEKVDGDTLVVSPSKGVEVNVNLEPDVTVQKVAKATADDVKQGSKIGAQVKTEADASLRAVQIIIFPEAPATPSGAGAQASKTSDANLMIAEVVSREASDKGPVITVQYQDGQKRILISSDAQIWRASSGTKADLRNGASVSLTATRKGGDAMTTNKLTVSQSGITPPL